jgi:hypothetical protein
MAGFVFSGAFAPLKSDAGLRRVTENPEPICRFWVGKNFCGASALIFAAKSSFADSHHSKKIKKLNAVR